MNPFLQQLVERFSQIEDDLNALDAKTGDGDHGSTILRGLRIAASAEEDPARAFTRATGGAAGPLFGQLMKAMLEADAGKPLADALDSAALRIATLGGAKAGDKTMLDALLPAATAAAETTQSTAASAARAARAGATAAKDMSAKRGRARYVENAGLGHLDAGATSVAEILAIYAIHKGELE